MVESRLIPDKDYTAICLHIAETIPHSLLGIFHYEGNGKKKCQITIVNSNE